MTAVRHRIVIVALCGAAVAFPGCTHATRMMQRAPASTGVTTASATTSPSARAGTVSVAEARVASVAVFKASTDLRPWLVLPNPNEDGAQRVFLVKGEQGDWLEVLLPIRPNGTRGWIKASDVEVTTTDWRIRIELNAHRITVWQGADVFLREPIGVGRADTPTPGGEYYIAELLQPPNPNGPYGPYAYGLSGYSDVLKNFAGGSGVIGLHGTNDPAGLGHDVSHGCIRLSNATITKLAHELPLGTPVDIAP